MHAPYTPEEDADEIWGEAYLRGKIKYQSGQAEHRSSFWSAGASWYAGELSDEMLDSVAYLHHLRTRLASIRSLAKLMKEDDAMTLSMAATILDNLVGDHPPKQAPRPHHHD